MHTVSSTDNLIDHMHKLDFKKLKNKNMEHVRAKSKELMQTLCDKDKVYFNNEQETEVRKKRI